MTNYNSLSMEELGSLAITDVNARAWIADHAEELLLRATVEDLDDPFYDDELHAEGADKLREKLSGLYSEQLLEWLAQVDNMTLAGDGDLEELEILLAAIHAEFEDEGEE